MEIKIRKASLKDIKKYANLLQVTYQHAYTNDSIGLAADCFSKKVFSSKNSQEYMKEHLIDNDLQKTWLAFSNNILVGAITCILKDDKEAEIVGFYVLPDYQNRGIGTKLYNLALKFAGKRDLLLDIYTHNAKTINIYKKWGWKLDKSRGDKGFFYRHWPEWPDGLEAKCIYMKLNRKN